MSAVDGDEDGVRARKRLRDKQDFFFFLNRGTDWRTAPTQINYTSGLIFISSHLSPELPVH